MRVGARSDESYNFSQSRAKGSQRWTRMALTLHQVGASAACVRWPARALRRVRRRRRRAMRTCSPRRKPRSAASGSVLDALSPAPRRPPRSRPIPTYWLLAGTSIAAIPREVRAFLDALSALAARREPAARLAASARRRRRRGTSSAPNTRWCSARTSRSPATRSRSASRAATREAAGEARALFVAGRARRRPRATRCSPRRSRRRRIGEARGLGRASASSSPRAALREAQARQRAAAARA